ncbi:MAG: class I SAM-dependent methyltransferase [Bacilli bacterium]|nr:class I SAM-dependent methyltransferase [Bacilli bacterium]
MKYVEDFTDYQIIDTSNGMKLEKWSNIYLLRPDPEVMWDNGNLEEIYKDKINAVYYRSNKGGGYWENKKKTPDRWQVKYRDLVFNLKQMGFKHTGLFPEQAYNWNYIREKIEKSNREIKVLNLFAYTGGATVASMKAGAHVTHVDSSRGMVDWAKENVRDNQLDETKVRYIVDDVIKFVKREIRRGNKYDAIIMDPPAFGRGANGEVWNIEKNLFELLDLCKEILSEKPLFVLVNSYSGLSPILLENLLKLTINKDNKGIITSSEIGLPIEKNNLILPCGIYGRIDYE